MDQRYSLRFETGERQGETIPIPASGLSVGRKPGNSLQIVDNSVSGKHADLTLDPLGVTVKDGGSTNGTRVGRERVIEQRLAHGDRVIFGNVELSFLDAEAGDPAAAVPPKRGAKAPDGLERIRPELIARSRKVSRPGLFVVALLVVGGGLWWFLNQSEKSGKVAFKAVEPVPGNLLPEDYSFEGDKEFWTGAESAPQAFLKSASAAFSGAFGMQADLGQGEWARSRSKEVHADAGKELVGRAAVKASGGASVRLGIELSVAESANHDAPGAFIAWSAPRVSSSAGPNAIEIAAFVPPGYDTGRLVVDAGASTPGKASFDDASLIVRSGEVRAAAEAAECRLYLHGEPPALGVLIKGERVLLSCIEFTSANAGNSSPQAGNSSLPAGDSSLQAGESVPQAVRQDANLIALAPGPGAHATKLSLRAEPLLVRGGIASLAAKAEGANSGYKTHGLEFARDGVQTLLLGAGRDMIALRFAKPVRLHALAEGASSRIVAEFADAADEVTLELDFREQRKEAGNVAHAAQSAEQQGELGECIRLWTELLDLHPYDERLVNEAEAARGKLVQQGLEELRSVRAEIGRARFFRLVDLYRNCRQKALTIGKRYAPSEVEAEAQRIASEVEGDLGSLEADLNKTERARLAAILKALEAQKATGLAAEVQASLAALGGGAK